MTSFSRASSGDGAARVGFICTCISSKRQQQQRWWQIYREGGRGGTLAKDQCCIVPTLTEHNNYSPPIYISSVIQRFVLTHFPPPLSLTPCSSKNVCMQLCRFPLQPKKKKLPANAFALPVSHTQAAVPLLQLFIKMFSEETRELVCSPG